MIAHPDKADPIGLIGLGLMGTVMAGRLVGAGFTVLGFDIEPAKAAALRELGLEPAGSVADVARRCRRIILAVFSTDQVEDVTDQLASARRGVEKLLVLCTSTCDPDRIAALAPRVAERGIVFVDAPVSGTSEQVARGDGLGLTGGDRAAVDAAADVLDTLFPRHVHVGAPGDAGRAKLAVNLILGLNRLALAEGLVLAERLGLDTRAFLDVAKASAAYSQVMDVKGEKMVAGNYTPQGRITQSLKDVHLMHDQASRRGQTLPTTEVYAEILEACVRQGEGDRDNCAVIEEIRRRKV
jgi:3-hydroxyisobutyrate dehydrogenase-like beta-hydroxyacid dehydrogenase